MSIEGWIAIGVPATTALIFVAYKHPQAYRTKVYPALSITLIAMLVVGLIHNIGVMRASSALLDIYTTLPADEKNLEMLDAVHSVFIPWIFFIVTFTTGVVAQFLTTLPKWLDIVTKSYTD